MIITHTTNAHGHQRVYLGGKSSMECWIEPNGNGQGWTFQATAAVSGNTVAPDIKRQWATHVLMQLCQRLQVQPDRLPAVPFDAIAALHDSNPYECRRMPTSRRKVIENGYLATTPRKRAVAPDFCTADYDEQLKRTNR